MFINSFLARRTNLTLLICLTMKLSNWKTYLFLTVWVLFSLTTTGLLELILILEVRIYLSIYYSLSFYYPK
jgi:hypothetical protein